MRGAAYEALGRIAEAEAELWAALQAQPNEPTFLNYLGYLWVDSGTRVAEGAAMIARAHAADPEDGNIQDSPRLGPVSARASIETAVETLEQAVDKEPANAEINDHLGDAYWQVGRQREAGFQWTRVLTLDPDAERRAEVEQKLADGLPPDAVARRAGGRALTAMAPLTGLAPAKVNLFLHVGPVDGRRLSSARQPGRLRRRRRPGHGRAGRAACR